MSRRATPLLVEDIWEAIEKIERYVSGLNHDAFVKDDKSVDSVVRNLEIIGETTNRLPEKFRNQHSEIEWRKIIGLRNRIVHDYFNNDVEIVWEIIQKDLPIFKSKLSLIRTRRIQLLIFTFPEFRKRGSSSNRDYRPPHFFGTQRLAIRPRLAGARPAVVQSAAKSSWRSRIAVEQLAFDVPAHWVQWVNVAQTEAEIEALRRCVRYATPAQKMGRPRSRLRSD